MAKCLEHRQEYDETRAGYCRYCGDPKDQHRPIKEVAKRLGISTKTARLWFFDEPGVMKIQDKPFNGRRESRVHLRVPETVIERVRLRHSRSV